MPGAGDLFQQNTLSPCPMGLSKQEKYNVNMSQLTRDIGDAKDAPQEEVREGCLEEAVLTYTSKRNNP